VSVALQHPKLFVPTDCADFGDDKTDLKEAAQHELQHRDTENFGW